MISRRNAIASGAAALAGGGLLLRKLQAADAPSGTTLPADGNSTRPRVGTAAAGESRMDQAPLPPGEPGKDYTPVITPNGAPLPFKVVDGVKVFHLIAEEIQHEFAPGLKATCWGYNGRTPGPTIEAVEGDRIRIYVTNRLPERGGLHSKRPGCPAGGGSADTQPRRC